MPIADSVRKLCLFSGFGLLLVAVGCGGNSEVLPHTTGNFSNASFKGSYVFEVHGFLLATGMPVYREIGVITADGNGNITAGTDYTAAVGLGLPASSASITGKYRVANDGTGQISLSSTALGSIVGASQVSLALTLASSSSAELIEADIFADGAGDAQLQDSSAIATPSGTFAFRIHQDTNGSASESQVGFFSISGGSLTGSMDENFISGASSLTLTSGSFGAPNGFGIGSGSFTDNASVVTNFFYFIVSSGKMVLLAGNSGAVGSGGAEAQQSGVSAGLNGTYVFGSRGDDVSSGPGGFATVGQFTGSGATISAGVLDSMQDTNYVSSQTQFTGNAAASPSAQGRVQIVLSTGQTVVGWMVSPARAFFLIEGESATEDGTADLQTSTSFSNSSLKGQYALVMDGIDAGSFSIDALARIGTLQFDGSGKTTLVEVVNESGSGSGAQSPGALAGTYQVGSSGRAIMQITSSGSGPDLVLYAISNSQAYALQIDAGTNTSGIVQLQQ